MPEEADRRCFPVDRLNRIEEEIDMGVTGSSDLAALWVAHQEGGTIERP